MPAALVCLEAMPLTPTGKIDRQALPLPENLQVRSGAAFVSPRTEAERTIAREWQAILQVEKVGVDDNFFDLGGHSLLVIALRDRLAAQFARELTAVDLFRYPTVASLARFLTATPETAAAQSTRVRELASRQKRSYQQQRLNRGRGRSDG
jgi:acyl carrier protein